MRAVFRPMRASDQPFIAATWSLGWRQPEEAALLDQKAWREAVYQAVKRLLFAPGVRVLVVGDADSPAGDADVFGYLATFEQWAEPLPLVLFLYVKPGARRAGLATAMLRRVGLDPAGPVPFVCQGRTLPYLLEAGKFPGAIYRPELGRKTHHRQERTDATDDEREAARAEAARAEAGGSAGGEADRP